VSDDNGSSDTFKVTYELLVPLAVKAGTYKSRVTYTYVDIAGTAY
jgi:hypothetical protein